MRIADWLVTARVAIVAAACAAVVGGCTGGVPNPSTPVAAAHEAFRLVDAGDLDALVALTCAAEQATIRRQFDFSDLGTAVGAGIDLSPLFAAIELDASALTITETSVTGDRASVLLAGPLTVRFDAEQLRDLFRRLSEQQGQTVEPERFEALIAALQATSQTVPINETIDVVREGGSWKLCSRLTLIR